MEMVVMYGFPCFSLFLWILGGIRRRAVMGTGRWMLQLLPALLVTGVMLVDDRRNSGGISASLLAADILFLNALVLETVRFQSEKKRVSHLFLLLAAAGLARSVVELADSDFPFDGDAYMAVVSGMILSYSVMEEVVRMFPSGRLRGILHERVTFVFMKTACAQALTFLAAVILSVRASPDPFGRYVSLFICLILAAAYLYLQSSLFSGTPVIRLMPVAAAVAVRHAGNGRERVTEESRRIDLLFERVEEYMRKERPYLDDSFTMTRLATEMMTNKSMLSKTINEKAGKNFCRYVNTYRIQYAVSLMKRDRMLKVSELSMMSGFHSLASFNMAFKLIMNDTPSEYMRTLHSAGLARTAAGERSGPRGRP
ncbi:MAG: helix-turn-helix transcriptional regulator [Bacteroidales bacterium]|nr:helix-turn-helix transcriptional regulator [Bacteroidales bacterium]